MDMREREGILEWGPGIVREKFSPSPTYWEEKPLQDINKTTKN